MSLKDWLKEILFWDHGRLYTGDDYLKEQKGIEPEILLPENAVCMRLPGTDGKGLFRRSTQHARCRHGDLRRRARITL